jgi:hypothetical protein
MGKCIVNKSGYKQTESLSLSLSLSPLIFNSNLNKYAHNDIDKLAIFSIKLALLNVTNYPFPREAKPKPKAFTFCFFLSVSFQDLLSTQS